eukprot:3596033-Rhodomonas_salina.1
MLPHPIDQHPQPCSVTVLRLCKKHQKVLQLCWGQKQSDSRCYLGIAELGNCHIAWAREHWHPGHTGTRRAAASPREQLTDSARH